MSFKEQILQKKNLWHLGSILIFLIVSVSYFSPTLTGHTIQQGDVQNWSGAAQEIIDYRAENGEETHWTNSMFSGMPSVQISSRYPGLNLLDSVRNAFTLWLPQPVSYLFLYFIGFYILSLSLKIKPHIGALGALAYGLSSYFIIILQAGHNTKALAIGYAPMVIAGFIWSYRSKKWFLPLALSALFMAFELRANHIQITYYLAILLVGLGIVELIKAINSKTIPLFMKRTAGLIIMYGVALMLNYGNIKGTLDYAKHTTRGGTELTINADGTPKEKSEVKTGLDTEYITAWSYGVGETFSLIIPNFKGGATQAIGGNDANKSIIKDIDRQYKQNVIGQNQYWGEQPFTSGPVYVGVIVMLLAFLALFYLDDKIKWALLAVTILTIMLSWGKNFLGFTQFFLDYLPGYNKFRAVTIILFIVELTIPILAVLFLNKLINKREEIAKNIMPFFIISGGFVLLFFLFLAVPSLFNSFLTTAELAQLDSIEDPQQALFVGDIFTELENVRIAIFRKDTIRSLVFLILGGGLIFAAIKNSSFAKAALIPILGILILIDLLAVDTRYLGTKTKGKDAQWIETWKQTYPLVANSGDETILISESQDPEIAEVIASNVAKVKAELKKDKIKGGEAKRIVEFTKYRTLNRETNFRVFEQGNPFNSSRASYFHKSIGGYHGAKLGRYQELIEFHLSQNNQAVLNMLNMKYVLAPGGQNAFPNPNALGNAWFVKDIQEVKSADEAILALNVNNSFVISTYNGFNINNVNKDSILEVLGNEELSLMSPTGELIPLVDIPFQASMQQEIALFATPQGLQWGYFIDISPDLLVVVKNKQSGFTPSNLAVLESIEAKKLSATTFTGEGTITLDNYQPNNLKYTSKSPSNQLAVFSEIYLSEGWTATIDNKETDILCANYTLRAIEIPSGEHQIEFRYNLKSYDSSNTIAMLLSVLILLLILGALYWEYIRENTNQTI